MPVNDDVPADSPNGPVVETAAMLLANPEIRSSGQSLEDIWKLAEEIVAKRQNGRGVPPRASGDHHTSPTVAPSIDSNGITGQTSSALGSGIEAEPFAPISVMGDGQQGGMPTSSSSYTVGNHSSSYATGANALHPPLVTNRTPRGITASHKPGLASSSARQRRRSQPNVSNTITMDSTDPRTTLMLKNIPNKYSRQLLVDEVMARMPVGSFDFVYMPIDFRSRCNFGYAFVNVTDPKYTRTFFNAFKNSRLPGVKSSKVCEVVYARVQGLQANVNRLINSPILDCTPEDDDDALPLVFGEHNEQIPFKKLAQMRRERQQQLRATKRQQQQHHHPKQQLQQPTIAEDSQMAPMQSAASPPPPPPPSSVGGASDTWVPTISSVPTGPGLESLLWDTMPLDDTSSFVSAPTLLFGANGGQYGGLSTMTGTSAKLVEEEQGDHHKNMLQSPDWQPCDTDRLVLDSLNMLSLE
ncbi:hypothetical protein FOL47_000961 [Perkinsus chesapeaki]|uniref:Mei2-like C-terminal RNA recognition motif domain-containing protein n=1 Tax=Perkinsus chesapeaki TaxID=330153 RepID=A0A7J6MKS7_PERCH|nr:hypothetical protein FOL47_000961 [Perkinsus chesapeaki]